MPFALVEIETEKIIRRYATAPTSIRVGSRCIKAGAVSVGDEGLGHRFVELVEENFPRPGQFFHQGQDTQGPLDARSVTVTRKWIPWTQQEIDDFEAAQLANRTANYDRVGGDTRALALLILDEINMHATRFNALRQAILDAGSLAEVKTLVGEVPTMPTRTTEQLRKAFENKLQV